MIKYFIVILSIFSIKEMPAQPWKLDRDFSLAFQSNYKDYKLLVVNRGARSYWQGFERNDTSKKVFDFEFLNQRGFKDGWFNRVDTKSKNAYSILFENGNAIKLSFFLADSSIAIYTIDSGLLNGVHTVYYLNGNIKEYGFYKKNARIGEWRFFNSFGKVESEGSYLGDYQRVLYRVNGGKLITLNRLLDTARIEKLTQKGYDSLKSIMGQNWGLLFPLERHFKTGVWKYYSDTGQLIKEEFYEKGILINNRKIVKR